MATVTSIAVNLTGLSDDMLLSQTKDLVHKEKQTTLEILQYLKEVERRRLYAQRGFSSLYAFCTEELSYSESQAHRRISSMRLIRDIPEVEDKIATGKLTLATASQAQSFFRKEAREKGIERKLEQKKEVLRTLEGRSKREVEKSLLELCPPLVKLEEKTKALSPEYTQISIVLTAEQEALLARLRELKPDKQSTAELFEWLMQRTLKQIDPLQKVKSTKPALPGTSSLANPPTLAQQVNPTIQPRSVHKFNPAIQSRSKDSKPSGNHLPRDSKGGRYIPSSFRQEIWFRAEGCCEFQDHKSGRRCGARKGLQVDHIQPLAIGGKTSLENLRLLCSNHNQWAAIQTLGMKKMKSYLK